LTHKKTAQLPFFFTKREASGPQQGSQRTAGPQDDGGKGSQRQEGGKGW